MLKLHVRFFKMVSYFQGLPSGTVLPPHNNTSILFPPKTIMFIRFVLLVALQLSRVACVRGSGSHSKRDDVQLPSDVDEDPIFDGIDNDPADVMLPDDPPTDIEDDDDDPKKKKKKKRKKTTKGEGNTRPKPKPDNNPKSVANKTYRARRPPIYYGGPSREQLLKEEWQIPRRVPELWFASVPRYLDGTLQDDFAEVYSPPRILPHAVEIGLRGDLSADLTTGYNLLTHSSRLDLMMQVKARRPKVLMLSPPCTMMSGLQNLNWCKMLPETREAEFREGMLHLNFSMLLADLQVSSGRAFIFEHPDPALSWHHTSAVEMATVPNACHARFHMCCFGLVSKVEKTPILKATKLLSNISDLESVFNNQWCKVHEAHQILNGVEGGVPRSLWAQRYPPDFCNAIAKLVKVFVENENESQGA